MVELCLGCPNLDASEVRLRNMAERESDSREEQHQVNHGGEAHPNQEERENGEPPGPALPLPMQNIVANPHAPNAMAPDEQQAAQRQLQTTQAEALSTALRSLAQREGAPRRSNRILPAFSASEEDEVDDWIHAVNAEARAGAWNDEVKLDMAKAALRGAAARWRPNGDVENEWETWSRALAEAF
ncbi:hypothetical protein OUZ56_018651 [Daphnia magna]|uniref:Uncharacterized protein n=1 Tax=Daphnia magna TaxID=35525 RepID=A0ABQ9Z9D8_9CRUS|nr:hypothetical protein OUZ56_018651 [Daphnia magna]